ncbi:MAG: hypothetical protein ABSA52_13360 [Candidatus Binatia bacterium]|jgi:hypothetical protein
MGQAAAMSLGLRASDVSGQKTVRASAVPVDATVGELVQGLLAKMGLNRNDVEGRPLNYYARLDREGRHLNGSEIVGDALKEGDEIVLTPNIDAGGHA